MDAVALCIQYFKCVPLGTFLLKSKPLSQIYIQIINQKHLSLDPMLNRFQINSNKREAQGPVALAFFLLHKCIEYTSTKGKTNRNLRMPCCVAADIHPAEKSLPVLWCAGSDGHHEAPQRL